MMNQEVNRSWYILVNYQNEYKKKKIQNYDLWWWYIKNPKINVNNSNIDKTVKKSIWNLATLTFKELLEIYNKKPDSYHHYAKTPQNLLPTLINEENTTTLYMDFNNLNVRLNLPSQGLLH